MPEFLFCLILAVIVTAVKRQQIRFIYAHFKRSSTDHRRASYAGDPYRSNPEVQRDCAIRRAETAEADNAKLQGEIAEIRMERDLANQERDLRVLKGRAKLGGAFVLGAITCFTSVNIAPQIASDMLTERPTRTHVRTGNVRTGNAAFAQNDLMVGLLTMAQRYYPYHECAPQSCCHRTRLHLIDFTAFTMRVEPAPRPIELYWIGAPAVENILIATSGGDVPPTRPQDPSPIRIERYALPATRENIDWVFPVAITMKLN